MVEHMAAAVLFIWASWCVLSPFVHDGIVGKLIFSCMALSAFAYLADGYEREDIQATMIICMAAIAVRHFALRTVWGWVRKLLPISIHQHQRRESDGA